MTCGVVNGEREQGALMGSDPMELFLFGREALLYYIWTQTWNFSVSGVGVVARHAQDRGCHAWRRARSLWVKPSLSRIKDRRISTVRNTEDRDTSRAFCALQGFYTQELLCVVGIGCKMGRGGRVRYGHYVVNKIENNRGLVRNAFSHLAICLVLVIVALLDMMTGIHSQVLKTVNTTQLSPFSSSLRNKRGPPRLPLELDWMLCMPINHMHICVLPEAGPRVRLRCGLCRADSISSRSCEKEALCDPGWTAACTFALSRWALAASPTGTSALPGLVRAWCCFERERSDGRRDRFSDGWCLVDSVHLRWAAGGSHNFSESWWRTK